MKFFDWVDAVIESRGETPDLSQVGLLVESRQQRLDSFQRAFQVEVRDQERVKAQVWREWWDSQLSPRSRWDIERWPYPEDGECPCCGRTR